MHDAGVNLNHVDDVKLTGDVVFDDEIFLTFLPISPSRLLKGP